METNLNLEKIIKDLEINQKVLAEILFPGNQFAVMALKRIIKGEALLNSDQVFRLSEFTGIPLPDLYEGKWKSHSKPDRPEIIFFERGNYMAELNTQTWITTLYNKGDKFKEGLIHGKDAPLSEYLEKLNQIFINQ